MAARKSDLDVELERLYRGPMGDFTKARNDLVKQLKKLGKGEDAERVEGLAKPTPSAWAVNVLFEREPETMETLLAAGTQASAGQREAVSGRGAEALRESLGAVRRLVEEMRRRAAALLAESGRSVSRPMIERIGTNLQSLALSPAAAEEARRQWLDRDLDPPGFEVLAGLQLAGAPVADLAARRAQREEKAKKGAAPAKKVAPVVHLPKPKGETERERKERERREAAEQARQEREAERVRRRVEVAEEKAERARNEAEELREAAEEAEKAASEARRRAEAAELAATRAREKADRAAERLERAEQELKEAKEGP